VNLTISCRSPHEHDHAGVAAGRGAVGMLVTWGVRQAEAEGVPAYLGASLLGKVNFPSNG
jgi:hypothetical protein